MAVPMERPLRLVLEALPLLVSLVFYSDLPSSTLTSTIGASPPPSSAGIEPWEILEKIPDTGISIVELIKPFQSRVGTKPGQMKRDDWIKLVTRICRYGAGKMLYKRK